MNQTGIRSYVLLLAIGPATVIATFLTIYFTAMRIHGLEESLHERGFMTARHLATDSEYAVISGSIGLLSNLVENAAQERYVISVVVLDRDFHVLAIAGKPDLGLAQAMARLGAHEQLTESGDHLVISEPISLPTPSIHDLFQDTAAKHVLGPPNPTVGYVTVVLSQKETIDSKNRMLLTGLGIAAAGLILTAGIALRFIGRVTRPIRELSTAVEKIADGALDTRVATNSRAELLVLQRGVNKMAASLQASQTDLERRIAEATAEILHKKEEAEQANSAKSRFLAAASHDLRQPMHALRLFVGALAERIHFEDVKTIVQHAEASVNAMEALLNALLDISRLDAGVFQPEFQQFPISVLLDHLAAEFGAQARDKKLRFSVVSCSAVVQSDPVMLKRILLNLVANAVRYTSQGGIVVGCRRRGNTLRLEVWDSGSGIPTEKQGEIFQEFVQLGNPERDRNKGLGLGLAIVDRLTKLLGTRIDIRSQIGKGSVFSFEVPRVAGSLPAPASVTDGSTSDFGKINAFIVVVDDELTILKGMGVLLTNWGCRVLTANSRKDVLDKLNRQSHVPALIISDYRLPGEGNGIDVIRAIQGLYGSQIPAVLISGDTCPERLKEAQASGYELLHKPVSPLKLRLLIAHLTSQGMPAESPGQCRPPTSLH